MHQPLDGLVCDVLAVAQMYIVQVLAQSGDGVDGRVRDSSTFREHQVAEARSHLDNPLYGAICQLYARGEIKDPQVLISPVSWQRKESAIVNEFAKDESKFPQRLSLGKQSSNGSISHHSALQKVNLE